MELSELTDLRSLVVALAKSGQRRLVLVEGEPERCRTRAVRLVQTLAETDGLWVGETVDAERAGLACTSARKHRAYLGQELSVLVWDGWKGTPPNAFAALSGALRAGGLLIWLMPPRARWGGFADPDYARTGLDQADHHPFAARLAAVLSGDAWVLQFGEDSTCSKDALAELSGSKSPTAFRVQTTPEQQQLIERLVRTGLGRRRRPLVVTADRGRGKSAALGIAAARLLQSGRERVLVTAPSADNVATLLRHAADELGAHLAQQSATGLTTTTGQEVCYSPPAELLDQKLPAEVVMVDEAAGIPAQWLREMLLGWPRVIFATTVHGYEGTGRGFALRFRQVLDRETPHWQQLNLSQPIRWASGDPLEQLISRLFLLSADAPENMPAADAQVQIEHWSPECAPETELTEAFGLLVNAHYRTTPADLRQWLDDPRAMSWRATLNGRTVGVLWATREGGLSPELAEDVTAGKRRVRGHLLAQSLANHGGFADAARLRTLRVVRIAVSESQRRRGLGRQLVQAARIACQAEGIDTLGTSFGGEVGLLRFWQGCGLQVVRMGLRQEASTGEFPLQLLAGISAEGEQLQQALSQRFARHWLRLMPVHWSTLEPELLLAMARSLPGRKALDHQDCQDLHRFGHGFRGYQLTLPVLQDVSACPSVYEQLSLQADAALWCRAVLQGWSWARVQHAGLCLGQRDGEQRLRAMVRALIQQNPEL
ncbi:tRNA(Met) cytidine acetyltransferase [Marinobacter fuscus]|uniref:tRNA(Met) cytidine acetyltransferase TmcA n=1 Tax=Marinobacter fuscus TaxID=2109942 RepID=A0A2T1K4N5_9GAMM|nr:GNAT family N-acetyltransferase [Marinobacter fuscus]PSF05119.1 tRNA(Met) cytidine acetyltransferase [Marinobacter fuscus]